MAGQHFCKKCGKTMNDSEFYTSKNVEKYPQMERWIFARNV